VAHGGQRRPAQAEAPADAVQVAGICNLASELQAGAAYGGFQCQWQRCVAATESARCSSAGADQFCLEWLAAIRAGGLQLQAPGAAFTCADLILGGYQNPIPLDETIDAVYAVGKLLPAELRCTAKGGLALAPSALRLCPRTC